MSTFNLGLPTDIPWERICFTTDMMHSPVCGGVRPSFGQSSIAVYSFTPDDEYQTLENYRISYVKVAVSLTPFDPNADANGGSPSTLITPYPCNGAVLQVSVGPSDPEGDARQIYFADAEPKKRELYEAVTDTGETVSGSQNRLSVGKSAMSSESTESGSRTGGSLRASIGIPIVGDFLSLGGEASSESHNSQTNTSQQSDVTTTDRSTERRELDSHTTQLSQMYNLFQAFHIGTNRTMFLIEPRPHIISNPASFIQGPRALEGIQEVFLVVVRPSSMADFCVNAFLETFHLEFHTNPIEEKETATVDLDMTAEPPSGEGPDHFAYVEKSVTYRPPEGWEIDVDRTRTELPNIILKEDGWAGLPAKATVASVTEDAVVLNGMVSWHTYQTGFFSTTTHRVNGRLHFNLLVYLKKKPDIATRVDAVFMAAREICGCTSDLTVAAPPTWISYEKSLKGLSDDFKVYSGPATQDALLQSTKLTRALRDIVIASLNSPERHAPQAVPFIGSGVYFARVASDMRKNGTGGELGEFIDTSGLIPDGDRGRLLGALGRVTVGDVIALDTNRLATIIGGSVQDALALKEQIVRTVSAPAGVSTTATGTPKVIGVRIGSTYPDAENPRIIAQLTDPRVVQQVPFAEKPNVIDVTFSGHPDDCTLSTQSFTVHKGSTQVATQLVLLTATTARLIITDPVAPGDLYTVRLRGSGTPAITFGGKRLDGDPMAIPSGDGIEGGDFTFMIRVTPTRRSVAPSEDTLIKVIGARLLGMAPDPASPRTLGWLTDPNRMLQGELGDQPNVIEVAFSEVPDDGTVTADSIVVTKAGAPVNADVAMTDTQVATITITDPVAAGDVYAITVQGDTSPAVTFEGRKLDGDTFGIPSGDNVEGGDFTFFVRVDPDPVLPPLPLPQLLKVTAARVRSTIPDSNNPRLLFEVNNPAILQQADVADNANIIDLDLSMPPDAGTVTNTTFTISDGATTLNAQVVTVCANTIRLKVLQPLEGGKIYTIRLASGPTGARFQGHQLDGEPLRFPSGEGNEGGDFTFRLKINGASMGNLLKVTGVRVLSQNDESTVMTMSDPTETLTALLADSPGPIELEFNHQPTMTGGITITRQGDGSTVSSQMGYPSVNTVRFTPGTALTVGTYTVTLSSGNAQYQGTALDGEPLALPSGNNAAGGDFTFELEVTSDQPMVRVTAARVISDNSAAQNPHVVTELETPATPVEVDQGGLSWAIELDFDAPIDEEADLAGCLNIYSDTNGSVQSDWTRVTATRSRFTLQDFLVAGTYQVTLSANCMAAHGYTLDGEPLAFPSGDGVGGGHFSFQIHVSEVDLLRVTNVRIYDSSSTEGDLNLITEVTDPTTPTVIDDTTQPGMIELQFNHSDFSGAVSYGLLTITQNDITGSGEPIPALIGFGTGPSGVDRAQIWLDEALVAGTYLVQLRSNGTGALLYNNRRLDGNPSQLPSGDGFEGGDFYFQIEVVSPDLGDQLTVTSARLMSSSPNPASPRTVHSVTNPDITQGTSDNQVDIIEVGFNLAPDSGTVNGSTFTLTKNGTPVSGTVSMPTTTTARITLPAAIARNASDLYQVTVRGGAEPTVKNQSRRLDGETSGSLPSGNGVQGGSFTFSFRVVDPLP